MNAYDVIGDIHGHADKLEALLDVMGYVSAGPGYQAPAGRQVVFLGDLIDRGPTQMRVLEIVRAMVETGNALCILGNHELNAIGFMTASRENPNEFLRPQSAKNRKQHREFLDQVGEGSDQHRGWIEWFKTLPLFLDLGGIRAVHGTWNEAAVAQVGPVYWDQTGQRMSDEFLYGCYERGSDLMAARKLLTCGLEWDLPEGVFINGKGGEQHKEVRIANWRHGAKRLREVALVPEGNADRVPDIPIPDHLPMDAITGSPVFIGHHWFEGHPAIESTKLACLDWSAAKGGKLVGYRWDGERELCDDKLIWV